jgi:hypothetical protein
MAYTQQQYSDLVAAIAEGVLSVRFSDGRQISYRSLSEMMNLKSVMEEELGVSGAGRRRHYASFRRD